MDKIINLTRNCPSDTRALTTQEIQNLNLGITLSKENKEFPNLYCTCNTGSMQNNGSCQIILPTCNSGYYLNGSTCAVCPNGCATCSSGSNCTSCNSGYHLNGSTCSIDCPSNAVCQNGQITCNAGYYLNGNSCPACPDGCATCSSARSCSSCNPGYYIYYDPWFGTYCLGCIRNAVCQNSQMNCNSGYYLTGEYLNGISCAVCPNGCATCSSGSNCTSCNSGYNLNGSSCVFNCPPNVVCQNCQITCNAGYYLNGSTCAVCPNGCATCSSGSSCTSCNSGYHLNGNNCECPPGTFLSNSECAACNSICLTCANNARNCTSCPAGVTLINHDGVNVRASCLKSPVEIQCAVNNKTCKTCTKSSFFLAHNNTCVSSCPSDTTTFNGFLILQRTYGLWFNSSSFVCLKSCPLGQTIAIYSLPIVNSIHLYSSCIASCPYPLTEGLCLTYLSEHY